MRTLIVAGIFLSLLVAVSCNSSTNGDDERTSCTQAIDCGDEGLNKYKCYFAPGENTGKCFTHEEFCTSDSDCVGSCENNSCTDGKTDGDSSDTDGDLENSDGDSDGVVLCEYQCCSNDDCPNLMVCNMETHTCVQECQYECCSPTDCAEGYVCQANKCVPDSACEEECCSDSDCLPGQTCSSNKCVDKLVNCTPGKETCCSMLPGYSKCSDLGVLLDEAVLTCNQNGNGYDLTQCPEFHDCIDESNGTTTCFYNGRCEADDDCDCPKECIQDEEELRCSPKLLEAGDVCYGTPCGDEKMSYGICPDSYKCCWDDAVNPTTGTCVPEIQCNL